MRQRRALQRNGRIGANTRQRVAERRDSRKSRLRRAGAEALKALRWMAFALVAGGAVGGAGYAGVKAYGSSELLMLREIEVEGLERLERLEVLRTAGVELGTRLTSIPVREVESRLSGHPWVEAAEVRRVPPGKMVVTVREARPVGMVFRKGWHGLAADGTVLPGLSTRSADLPVVETPKAGKRAAKGVRTRVADDEALRKVAEFLAEASREHPALAASFSQVRVIPGGALEIYLRDGRLRVLAPMEEPGGKRLEFLQALLESHGRGLDQGLTVDLRVEGYAYVR